MLTETVCLDNTKSSFLKSLNLFLKNNITIMYIYYFHFLKAHLYIITSVKSSNKNNLLKRLSTNNNSPKIQSIDKTFKSSS